MTARHGVFAVLVLALAGCASGVRSSGTGALPAAPVAVPASAQQAVVDRLVDGDTFWVRPLGTGSLRAGGRVKVRLLEYNAPERGQCWYGEASHALGVLTPVGSRVWLAADRVLNDRYGRALRYVWNGRGTFVDLEMVRLGMGRALLVRPNDAHIAAIDAAEVDARRAGRGLWGSC